MRNALLRTFAAYALLMCFVPLTGLRATPSSIDGPKHSEPITPDSSADSLARGKKLLRSFDSAGAYNYLKTALDQYTAAGDAAGAAAVQDAFGDLYTLNGQYSTSIKFYNQALDSYRRLNNQENANALLSKIGERYFLLGDVTRAKAAFASIKTPLPEQALAGQQKTDDGSKDKGAAAVFASASLSSCLGSRANGNNNDPANPPNQGHAPNTPYGSGRMDLRITDENGQPLKGVKAQIQSRRPDNLYCECWNETDQYGRALMPPLHIAPKIKLVLKAPGQANKELLLTAEDLAQPVQVVLSKTGASLAGSASNSYMSNLAAPCLGFYRGLIAFAASENGQAKADYYDGNLAGARAHYENLIKQLSLPGLENLREVPMFRTAAQTALGDIALKEGRLPEAIALYKVAIASAQKDRRPDLQWGAQLGLGRAYWKQSLNSSDPRAALQARNDAFLAYQDALKTVETIREGSLRADEVRSTFLSRTKDVYDEAATLLAGMALFAGPPNAFTAATTSAVVFNGSGNNFLAMGYRNLEQGRARSLLEMLSEAGAGVTEGIPPELVKRRAEIVDRQQELAELLLGVSAPGGMQTIPVPDIEAEIDRLNTEYDGLENQIRTRSPKYASLAGSKPLSVGEIQQSLLDDQTSLLVYSLGRDQSTLWIINKQSVALARLPGQAEIENKVLQFREQLIPGNSQRGLAGIQLASDATRSLELDTSEQVITPQRAGKMGDANTYAEAAGELYNVVLKPAASLIEGKRLLIVADGALNYVPFQALVTSAPSDKADFSSLAYLLKTNEVVYTPSASVIAEVRQLSQAADAGSASAANPILVVADPVFSASDARVKVAGAVRAEGVPASSGGTRELTLESGGNDGVSISPAAGLRIPRLVNTREEAKDIAQLAGKADVWLDLDANENNLLSRDMTSYRVIHFATHGLLNTDYPQFTGLVLSLIGQRSNDGFLRVNEVFNMKLGRPMVMLSACETGLGREKRGEGIIGLSRAFMYAGAPTVGASLWAVSDRSTANLMTEFYSNYLSKKGETPSDALRTAQLKMVSDNQFNAPYYWAPFIIIGDWKQTW